MEHLWQSPYVGDARACDTHIANLRAKIERTRTRPERIVTVRSIGYKLAQRLARASPHRTSTAR